MTFTEEDMDDDARIKREAGPQLEGVLSRDSPEVMEYYRRVCDEELGINPGTDLADMAIRALENENLREAIMNTEVSLRQAKINEIRKDDLEFVFELHDEFGSDPADSMVDEFIESYMERSSSLFGRKRNGDDGGSSDQVRREIDELKHKIEELASEPDNTRDVDVNVEPGVDMKSKEERKGEVRDMMDRGESEEDDEPVFDTEELDNE